MLKLFAVSFLAALLAGLPIVAFAGPEPWSSIRTTGGISLGPPFRSPDGWLLVVRANLWGLGALSQDSQAKSSPSCKSTNAVIEGDSIYLTIVSGPASSKVASVCPAAKIGKLESGTYKVFYRGPNEPPVLLKEVEFGG